MRFYDFVSDCETDDAVQIEKIVAFFNDPIGYRDRSELLQTMAAGAEPGEANNNTILSDQNAALNPGEAEDKQVRAVLSKDADLKAMMGKNKNLGDADLVKVKT